MVGWDRKRFRCRYRLQEVLRAGGMGYVLVDRFVPCLAVPLPSVLTFARIAFELVFCVPWAELVRRR